MVSTAAAAAALAKAESQRRELPPLTMAERQAEKARVLERMVNQNIFNDITHGIYSNKNLVENCILLPGELRSYLRQIEHTNLSPSNFLTV